MDAIRDWLEATRKERGFTKKALADRVGLEISVIGKYERGERRPSVENAKAIAAALGFDWTKFFDNEETT